MEEKWKKIEGYRYYKVSNLGRVKSINAKGNWGDTRILKIIVRSSGYCVVNLYSYKDGEKSMKQERVHQLVAKAFVSNPEDKPIINHLDGNKENNRADNLEWCNHSENMTHAYENGLCHQPKGVKTTKLNPKLVREIRKRYKHEDISAQSLGSEYGVVEGTILNVVNKKSWKWV